MLSDRGYDQEDFDRFDIETKDLPTRVVFDSLVKEESIELRPHGGADRIDVETQLHFPSGIKGALLKQAMGILRMPSEAFCEAVGNVSRYPNMKMVVTWMEGIPFSETRIYSKSRRDEVISDSDPEDLGDLVAFVGLTFGFPKTTRRFTVVNAKEIRLRIDTRHQFNQAKFDRSTPEGLTDEGLATGLIFHGFRRAYGEYLQHHPRSMFVIDTVDALRTITQRQRPIY